MRGRDDDTTATHHYDAVLVANGHHWDARLPEPAFPGADTFTGVQVHSHDYKTFDGFEAKRVLVLGIGNSACDIAVETSKVSARTFLAMRRGAHVVPKYVFGIPTDHLTDVAAGPDTVPLDEAARSLRPAPAQPRQGHRLRPARARPQGAARRTRRSATTCSPGSVTATSSSGRTSNASTATRCSSPTAAPSRSTSSSTAPATGSPSRSSTRRSCRRSTTRFRLFHRVVDPDHPGLYFIGLVQPLGAMMPLAEAQSQWVADLLDGTAALPSKAEMRREIARYHRKLEKRYVKSKRHTIQVDFLDHLAELSKERTAGAGAPVTPADWLPRRGIAWPLAERGRHLTSVQRGGLDRTSATRSTSLDRSGRPRRRRGRCLLPDRPRYANVCSCRHASTSCTPIWTRSTHRSSSATVPWLRGRPVIVGAGVVLAASYEAKAFGVRSAMSGSQARRLCPHAVVMPLRFEAYSAASKAVFAVFRDTTPLVEADVDRRGVPGRRRAAARVRHADGDRRSGCGTAVRERVGLPITVGVARTKFLAKVASAVGKPDGLLLVPADQEREFLHPLPVERLWGVGRITAAKLHERGHHHRRRGCRARTSAHWCRCSGRRPVVICTRSPSYRDPRPVLARSTATIHRRAKGVGPLADWLLPTIDATLIDPRRPGLPTAADRAGGSARTVVLRLRFDDFSRVTRSHTLPRATDDTAELLAALRALLALARPLIRSAWPDAAGCGRHQPRRLRRRPAGTAVRAGQQRAGRSGRRHPRTIRRWLDYSRRAARPRSRADRAAAARLTVRTANSPSR